VVAALIFAFLVPDQRRPEPPEVELASDFPVPPLDLAIPSQPRHRLRTSKPNGNGPLGGASGEAALAGSSAPGAPTTPAQGGTDDA
jgi:NADH-quinone oxidoreductase subunit H